MKTKKIILSFLLILATMGVKGQEWRGFVEIYAGISPMKHDIQFTTEKIVNVWNPLSFGLNYTMGIKALPQFYAGIGIGGYTAMTNMDYYYNTERIFPSLYFPVFANIRWIPDISRKINPFVDLKIGYQMGVDLKDSDIYYLGTMSNSYYLRHKNGLFLQPGVGVRFGRESAFNLGLAYNVSMRREFSRVMRTDASMKPTETFTRNYGFFMVTFGADF